MDVNEEKSKWIVVILTYDKNYYRYFVYFPFDV